MWGAIIQSYKLFAESSGIQEYISFSLVNTRKNTATNVPLFLNELSEIRIWKNGTVVSNTYIIGADSKTTVGTTWSSCSLTNGGINFYTADHSILWFKKMLFGKNFFKTFLFHYYNII